MSAERPRVDYRGFHLLVHPAQGGGYAMRVNGDLIGVRQGSAWGTMTRLKQTVDEFLTEEVAPAAKP